MSRHRCVSCDTALTLTSRKARLGNQMSCRTCGQVYVSVDSRLLLVAVTVVIILTAANQWLGASVAAAIAAGIGVFGTRYYAIDPARVVPALWTRK